MTAKDIDKALQHYYKDEAYRISNVYFFRNETDFLAIRKSGYFIGVEIKISKSDLKCDLKKKRHQLLLDRDEKNIENFFYYAVPEGMVTADMIPEYAGLLYISEHGIKEVKKAPKLHSFKHEYKNSLFNKMYYGYREAKQLKEDPQYSAQKKLIRELEKKLEVSHQEVIRLRSNSYELISEIRYLKKKA